MTTLTCTTTLAGRWVFFFYPSKRATDGALQDLMPKGQGTPDPIQDVVDRVAEMSAGL